MMSPQNAQLARLVNSEVGTMERATEVVIMRVETEPLTDDQPHGEHDALVLILSRSQADRLRQQLSEAVARSEAAAAR